VATVNKAIAVHISPALCTPITPFPADPICSQRVTMHCQWGKKTPICPFPWDFVILPQEDRATAIGNMHRKIGKDRACWFRRYPGGQTDRQTCSSVITILRHSVKTFVTTQVNNRVLLSCYSCRAAIYRSVDDFGTLFSFSAAAILSPTLTPNLPTINQLLWSTIYLSPQILWTYCSVTRGTASPCHYNMYEQFRCIVSTIMVNIKTNIFVKFGHAVYETDTKTHRHAHRNTSHAYRGRNNK